MKLSSKFLQVLILLSFSVLTQNAFAQSPPPECGAYDICHFEGEEDHADVTVPANAFTVVPPEDIATPCAPGQDRYEATVTPQKGNGTASWGQELRLVPDAPKDVNTECLATPPGNTLYPRLYKVEFPDDMVQETRVKTASLTMKFSGTNITERFTVAVVDDDVDEGATVSVRALPPSTITEGNDGRFEVYIQSGTAPGDVLVSWQISGDIEPISLNNPFTLNGNSQTITVTSSEDNDQDNETIRFTITSVNSPNQVGTSSATINVIDDDVPPPLVATIRGVDNGREEGQRPGSFEVNLNQEAGSVVRINYSVDDQRSEATEGVDFSNLPGFVFIEPGGRSASITIDGIVDDEIDEGDEDVILILTGTTDYQVGDPGGSAGIIIEDNDQDPGEPQASIRVDNPDISEGDPFGDFTVILNQAAPADGVEVKFNVNGTAMVGDDYNFDPPLESPDSPGVTISAGGTEATIRIRPIDDMMREVPDPETIILTLADGAGYGLGSEISATMNIDDNDDDDTPGIRVSPTSLTVVEDGSTAEFTVVLATQPSADVTTNLESTDEDEGTINRSSLTFTPENWDVPQTVVVTGIADGVDDGDQTFTVRLDPATSADEDYNGFDPDDVTVINEDIDDPPESSAEFVMDKYSVSNDAGEATITVRRVGSTEGQLKVYLRTDDDHERTTATAPDDYTSTEVEVIWEDGDSEDKTVQVPIVDDDETGTEVVVLNLESDSGEMLDTADLEISGDVPPPQPITGLAPNQEEVWRVVQESCAGGEGINEEDFQDLCNALLVTDGNNQQKVTALKQATADSAAAVRSSGMSTSNVQMVAVDGRIGALIDGGGAGFSTSGLTARAGELSLSGDLVKSFVSAFDQNDPAFMQTNANQGDDSGYLDQFGRVGVWMTGTLVFGEKDPTTNQIDYDFDTAGLTMGMDYRFSDGFVAGLAVGYASTETELGDGGDLDTTGYTVTLYGTVFNAGRFHIGGSLGYGNNDYDHTRHVRYTLSRPEGSSIDPAAFNVDQTMGAEYDGTQFSAGLRGGWDFNHEGLTFGPTFGVRYIDVDVDAYDEILYQSNRTNNSTTGWAVHIDDQNYSSLQVSLGFELTKAINRDWGVFIPQGYIDIVSELDDGASFLTGRYLGDNFANGQFSLMTDDFEETFARVGFGFGFVMGNNKSAFIMADGDLGRDLLETYFVNAGFRWQW
jgi:uncharacterized protein YhjY with autotransporter beta-barrel domain